MFFIALGAWSVVGGLLYLFVGLMTGSEALDFIIAGLTGIMGGCTTAHLMRRKIP